MSSNELMGTLTRGFSATVRMELITNEATFPLSHMCKDRVRLRQEGSVPTGEGEVRLWVDGHLQTWRVRILPGVDENRWVRIEDIV
jgi:RNA 3'-terminal phosphate cyclase